MLRQLHFETQAVGFDRVESSAIVAVAFTTVAAGVRDRLPLAVLPVKGLPRFREPAFADARVVEPIDFNGGDAGGFGEIVLHPLVRSLGRPPVEMFFKTVSRTLRFVLIVN